MKAVDLCLGGCFFFFKDMMTLRGNILVAVTS